MKRTFSRIGVLAFLFILFTVAYAFVRLPNAQMKQGTFSDIVTAISDGKVVTTEVTGSRVVVTLTDKSKIAAQKEGESSLTESLTNLGIPEEKIRAANIVIRDQSGSIFLLSVLLPIVLPILLIGGFIWFMSRQVQGSQNRALGFGQAQPRLSDPREKEKTTFKDVAGNEEAKTELMEVVEFLKYPKKFAKLGARIPKGVLLVGAPGTGKTLLARAVAGEAGVPFFHISGSEFVEMFVGVGASRVRDLFRKARKYAPCILFIDEIDAVGRQRGAGLGGSHDEREQTLNQILVEMDGFDAHTNVIVMAATNRPDVLDPALLRPGRFDRRVVIDLPDRKDREKILAVHVRGKPLAENADLDQIAARTAGFSGADLANLVNEAAILAARRDKKEITMDELRESIEKVMLGPERRSHVLSKREKEIASYHEGGHALVAHVIPEADPVQKVSIVARGMAAGYTMNAPTEDKHMHSKREFLADIAVAMGGYGAEEVVFDELTTGAANDLRRATQLARKLVTQYGMSEKIGPVTLGEREELIFLGRDLFEQRNYSEKTASDIDNEVRRLVLEAKERAIKVLKGHRKELDMLAKVLMEKETIEKEEFDRLMGGPKRPETPPEDGTKIEVIPEPIKVEEPASEPVPEAEPERKPAPFPHPKPVPEEGGIIT
ncbi:MAG: ATP-dependent zinc metalloprotease FtsH [Parcubacteria group bacterium]|nr:ATP-dependent zinc metalloprotease FtsH [Parcubacteria group bacterium]